MEGHAHSCQMAENNTKQNIPHDIHVKLINENEKSLRHFQLERFILTFKGISSNYMTFYEYKIK